MAHLHLTERTLRELQTDASQEEFYDAGFCAGGSFGVRVSKGGRKAFFLIYPLHGRRKRLTLGTFPLLSLEAARESAMELLKEVVEGRDPAAQRRRYRQVESFGAFAERFLAEAIAGRCAESTQREYRRIVARELQPVWGDRKLTDIGEQDVHQLLADIALERNSPVMANRVRALAGRIFNYACSKHLRSDNPVAATERVIEEEPRKFSLTLDEVRELWELLESIDPRRGAAFKLLLLTGQRVKDVLQMRWRDVSLDAWAVGGDREHRIYLSPQAVQVLRSRQLAAGAHEYVFASNQRGPISEIRKAARQLNAQLTPELHWSPSDLRRTVEAGLQEIGVRPDVAAYILNRKSALRRMTASAQSYDYFPETQRALVRWARTIVPPPGRPSAPTGGKVIPLFKD